MFDQVINTTGSVAATASRNLVAGAPPPSPRAKISAQITAACKRLGLPANLRNGLLDAAGVREPSSRVAGPQAPVVQDLLLKLETYGRVPRAERNKLLNIFVTPGDKRGAYLRLASHEGFWKNLSSKQRMQAVRNVHMAKTAAAGAQQAERVRTLLGSTCFHSASNATRMWALTHPKRAAHSVSQSFLPAKIDIIRQAKGKLAQHLAEVKQRAHANKSNLKLARKTWKMAIATAKHCHDNWFKPVPHVVPVQTWGEFWNNTASYPNWYEKAQKVMARLGAETQRYIHP